MMIPPDVLVVLVSPESTFDQRKAAAIRLATMSWERGWDACAEEMGRVVAKVIVDRKAKP